MKATNMTLIAALTVGSLLTLSPALRADDATNAPSSKPSMGGPPPGDRGPGMRGRGPNIDILANRLNLTDEQKPKVKAIVESEREQMRKLWQDRNLSREDRMTKAITIRDDTRAKLKAVLTADQLKKFQDMRQMRGGRRQGPPPWGPRPGNPSPDNSGTNAPPQK